MKRLCFTFVWILIFTCVLHCQRNSSKITIPLTINNEVQLPMGLGINLKRIEEMLYHLKRIYNGSVSREAVDQQLGAKYAKEYVDPLVNKMDADKKIEFK